jgi:DNA-binding transcriptional MerR regulator
LRAADLASEAGVGIDTIRYYQHRGLLPPPERKGREAFYSEAHIARLARIKELKEQGLSLATIQRILGDGIHPADAALLAAVSGTSREDDPALSLEEVAEETGVSMPLLESLVAEGLLVPRNPGAERAFSESDVESVRAGMVLLEAGVPLSDLLSLGHRYTEAVRAIADEAAHLFDEHIRRPSRDRDEPPVARDRVLEMFDRLLPAASALVRHNFEREVLAAAHRLIERTAAEIAGQGRKARGLGSKAQKKKR